MWQYCCVKLVIVFHLNTPYEVRMLTLNQTSHCVVVRHTPAVGLLALCVHYRHTQPWGGPEYIHGYE